MVVGKIFSRGGGGNSGFFQVVAKGIFQGWPNSGEISLYQLESKTQTFFYKKLIGKYEISKSVGSCCHAFSFVDVL